MLKYDCNLKDGQGTPLKQQQQQQQQQQQIKPFFQLQLNLDNSNPR